MKVTVEIQVYNNQEHPDGSILIVARPDGLKQSGLIDLIIDEVTFEVDGQELIAAIQRASCAIANV
jgi:hypothetical protein